MDFDTIMDLTSDDKIVIIARDFYLEDKKHIDKIWKKHDYSFDICITNFIPDDRKLMIMDKINFFTNERVIK